MIKGYMKTWTSNLQDQQRRREFEARLLECQDVLDRLKEICETKQNSSTREMRNKTKFSNSSWTHEMAGELGYQRALEELIELLEIKHD